MRINHLGNVKERNKSALTTRVDLYREGDIFGDCTGVSILIDQSIGKIDHVCFAYLILSPEEARSLGNRLIEAYQLLYAMESKVVTEHIAKDPGQLPAWWPQP